MLGAAGHIRPAHGAVEPAGRAGPGGPRGSGTRPRQRRRTGFAEHPGDAGTRRCPRCRSTRTGCCSPRTRCPRGREWDNPQMNLEPYIEGYPDIPVLMVTSWYGHHQWATFRKLELLAHHVSPKRVIVGTWLHADPYGQPDFVGRRGVRPAVLAEHERTAAALVRRLPARPGRGDSGGRTGGHLLPNGRRHRAPGRERPAGARWRLVRRRSSGRRPAAATSSGSSRPTAGWPTTAARQTRRTADMRRPRRPGADRWQLDQESGHHPGLPDEWRSGSAGASGCPRLARIRAAAGFAAATSRCSGRDRWTRASMLTGPLFVDLWLTSDSPACDVSVKIVDEYPASADWPEGFALNIAEGYRRCASWTEPVAGRARRRRTDPGDRRPAAPEQPVRRRPPRSRRRREQQLAAVRPQPRGARPLRRGRALRRERPPRACAASACDHNASRLPRRGGR